MLVIKDLYSDISDCFWLFYGSKYNPERDIPILTNHCEEFIRFLEENRELITDKKIFGGEN